MQQYGKPLLELWPISEEVFLTRLPLQWRRRLLGHQRRQDEYASLHQLVKDSKHLTRLLSIVAYRHSRHRNGRIVHGCPPCGTLRYILCGQGRHERTVRLKLLLTYIRFHRSK